MRHHIQTKSDRGSLLKTGFVTDQICLTGRSELSRLQPLHGPFIGSYYCTPDSVNHYPIEQEVNANWKMTRIGR